jgi:hypothetical protein
MAHSHEHTHADGTVHSHEHSQTHTHGEEISFSSHEEALALLKYMLSHNRHHAEELHELAHEFEGEAGQLLHEAVDAIGESNEKLEKALELICK